MINGTLMTLMTLIFYIFLSAFICVYLRNLRSIPS